MYVSNKGWEFYIWFALWTSEPAWHIGESSILFYQVINRVKMAEGQKIPFSKIINVIVKTPKEKIDIEIEEDASIKDVSPFYPVLYFCC